MSVALAVIDGNEIHLHGLGADGRVDYSSELPWPSDWPQHVTPDWFLANGIQCVRA